MKWIPWQIFNSRIYKSKVDTLYIGYIIHLRDNDMRKLNPNEILFGVKQRNFNPANIMWFYSSSQNRERSFLSVYGDKTRHADCMDN